MGKLLGVLLVLWLIYWLVMLVGDARPVADTSLEFRLERLPIPQLAPQSSREPEDRAGAAAFSPIESEGHTPERSAAAEATDILHELVLRGTFSSADSRLDYAIIWYPSGREEHYRVGDSLPGGILVHDIMPDRVILSRNDQYETLPLLREDGEPAAGMGTGSTMADGAGGRDGSDQRPVLKRRGSSLMELVQPQPVREGGRFIGFRLNPLKNDPSLRRLGLRQDDVVTWVNEVDIDNPLKGVRALSSISSGDYVNMTVRRGGRDFSLSFHMPGEPQ